MWKVLTPALLAMTLALPSWASSDELGLSARQAYEQNRDNDQVLLVDVRDPVEIMFVGGTNEVDVNVPYLLVDRSQWDEDNQRFRLYRNPQFIEQIKAALAERGLDETATVITMCRSGSERGLPSAEFLREHGFSNARYVVHGFQGDAIKEGERTGFRLVNGWQNEGLPWSPRLSPDKLQRPQ
ncbi:rhodanese-like protein [Oceanimonas sp. GK1]|uniref:rhodanese-like domain-containing protein n=1 Tax=Oceanimonas sp. (strain GK1 / IBRC-M 10197) TaxID=511062 RepID=UPI00024952FB|nr:rhodanese-like domain-containing protein [Oceanimonas sp. GK1]AEY01909.1 rhodanese-like protein [Oceanimonas sp. GK1]